MDGVDAWMSEWVGGLVDGWVDGGGDGTCVGDDYDDNADCWCDHVFLFLDRICDPFKFVINNK